MGNTHTVKSSAVVWSSTCIDTHCTDKLAWSQMPGISDQLAELEAAMGVLAVDPAASGEHFDGQIEDEEEAPAGRRIVTYNDDTGLFDNDEETYGCKTTDTSAGHGNIAPDVLEDSSDVS